MERKLIKQGGGGFTIYLPKKWVEENNLEKGNELSIAVSGKDLVISPKPTDKKSETNIDLKDLTEPSIRSIVTNTYRLGYDRIVVIFNSEKQFSILQEVVKTRLIGFDIIKKETSKCIIENITEPSYDQFDNIVNKMFLSIFDIFDITEKKLKNQFQNLEDFEEVEQRIHKYDNFLRRVIIKEKLIKQKSELFWTFLTLLIHSQRELYFLNKYLTKPLKISSQTINLLEEAIKIFKTIETAYFNKNPDNLKKIPELERNLIYKKSYELLRNPKESIIIHHIASCIRQLNLSTSPLSGMLM
jgi:phosphate uptake regulator